MTREDFLARCANAYDSGRVTPMVLEVLQRWADMVMRLQGGQWDIFQELAAEEKKRTRNFGRKLANDATGYKAIELMAILCHPCQICAVSSDVWWTRTGFCQHHVLQAHNITHPVEE